MAIENSSSEADGDNINGSGHVDTSRSISSFDSFDPLFLQNSDIPGSSHSRPHYEESESSALAAAAVSRYGSDSKQKQRSIVSSQADGDNINGSGHVDTSRSISSFDSFDPLFLQNSDIPGSSHSRPHYEESESSALAAAAVSRYGSDSKQKQRSIVSSRYDKFLPSSIHWIKIKFSRHDYSLFTKKVDQKIVMILVYVDDLIITGNDLQLIKESKNILQQNFKIKDLGELRYFLGIEFLRSSKGILMTQRKYILELISEWGLAGAKPAITPLEQHMKFTTSDYDKHLRKHDNNESDDPQLIDKHVYQRLVGKLLYVAVTRPDISYAVQTLSQFMHDPKQSHLEGALHVVRYLKGRPGLGILLSSKRDCTLRGFCDSDWASCAVTRKSVTGYCMKLGNSLISWKSKKQETISRSTAEAEYRSMASAVAEVIWLVGLLEEMNMKNLLCSWLLLLSTSNLSVLNKSNSRKIKSTK
uniref:Reverse transcriptase Ty1/copia-type domain-containing protein n=1 Tax=Solanum lycopersicum TaxID=4081 RepID=A0A3Q7FKL7_SOLLC